MSFFHFKLSNYKPVKISREIKRITKIDRQKLQYGIDIFQKELDWQQMWTVEDSEKRLEDGWWFYVAEKDNKYIGWAWFDTPNKKFCNLYVHKDYRNRGYGKELAYARLNECKNQLIENVNMHIHEWNKSTHKIINHIGWTPKIYYTFWTGGYDSTFLVCKFLLEGKIVQPIYIDDRVNHGGYHSNPLIVQRGEPNKYPRKSTEIELERMDWLRNKIYDRIPNSKELLLDTIVIDEPIKEDEEISRVVEKYNEWIPDTVVSKGWLPVYTDLVARFQKQFGLEVFWANDHIDGEFYEVFDDSIEDGKMKVDKLPSKYKDLKIFSGLNQPLRTTNKKEMLEEAEQFGFDELLYYTWTCWYPINEEPCGECHVCNERIIECKEITNE
jgi:7-cyano-7-deazaguanine synthase in queuosine biosynthesis/GNAT superfamily N-acetyltransferase